MPEIVAAMRSISTKAILRSLFAGAILLVPVHANGFESSDKKPAPKPGTIAAAVEMLTFSTRIDALFKGSEPYAEIFAPQFIAKISEARFRAIVQRLEARNGRYLQITNLREQPDGTYDIVLQFERGERRAIVSRDEDDRQSIGNLELVGIDMEADLPDDGAA